MFDFNWSEFALIGVVALLVIGPKDMPVAIRALSNVVKKGRKLAGEFQSHVDEMVREADLGEARDGLRQLRSLNVRGQIMRAFDEDGSLRKTLNEKPLRDIDLMPAGPRHAPQSLPPQAEIIVGSASTPPGSAAAPNAAWTPLSPHASLTVEPDPADGAEDPAPAILPPSVARRLRVERARPDAPAFVPPHVIRAQHPASLARPF